MKIILVKNLFFKEVGYCAHIAPFLRIICFMTSIYVKKNYTVLTFHLSLYLHRCHAVSLKKTKQFACFDNVFGLKKNWLLFRIADVQTSQALPHSPQYPEHNFLSSASLSNKLVSYNDGRLEGKLHQLICYRSYLCFRGKKWLSITAARRS